jgi:hypothetical protein
LRSGSRKKFARAEREKRALIIAPLVPKGSDRVPKLRGHRVDGDVPPIVDLG